MLSELFTWLPIGKQHFLSEQKAERRNSRRIAFSMTSLAKYSTVCYDFSYADDKASEVFQQIQQKPSYSSKGFNENNGNDNTVSHMSVNVLRWLHDGIS